MTRGRLWRREIVALELGSHDMKVVVGKQVGNKTIVSNAFVIPIPAGYYSDGRIVNGDRLRELLLGACKEYSITLKSVVCTFESTFVITREIVIPAVKDDFFELIYYEAKEFLPIDLEQYVVEYKIVEEFFEEGVENYRIVVAALPREVASDLYEWIASLGANPVALDLNSNAISKLITKRRMINQSCIIEDKTVAILDIGENDLNVVIAENGIYKFSRMVVREQDPVVDPMPLFTLEYGIDEVAVGTEPGLIDVNNQYSGILEYWVQEANRIFKYYTSRGSQHEIDTILVYGESSLHHDVSAYMQEAMDMEAIHIRDLQDVEFQDEAIEMAAYLNAIGAIIRHDSSVHKDFNFFQPFIKEPAKTSPKRLLRISLATVVAFCAIVYPSIKYIELQGIDQDVELLHQELRLPSNQMKLQNISIKEQEVKNLKHDAEFLVELDKEVQMNEMIDESLFRQLYLLIPDGIYITSIQIDHNDISIGGFANQRMIIAQMENQIRRSGIFSHAFVSNVAEEANQHTFSISFAVQEGVMIQDE